MNLNVSVGKLVTLLNLEVALIFEKEMDLRVK